MTERQVPSRLLCCSPGFQNCCTTRCPLLPCAPNHPLNYTPKKKTKTQYAKNAAIKLRQNDSRPIVQTHKKIWKKYVGILLLRMRKSGIIFTLFVSSALTANVRPRLSTYIQKEKAALHRFKILSSILKIKTQTAESQLLAYWSWK